MISASELKGVLGMMPAFATPDAADIKATQTIAVDNLKEGVDKIIKDGVHNIATTGTYGECYSLLFDEFKTLAVATVETVKKRVPLFIGVTSPNPREVIQKMNFVKDLGADGVLLGVPYYETLHVQDAIKFYHDIADLYPNLNIVVYHNPDNHKFTIPVAAFHGIGQETQHHRHEGQPPNDSGVHESAEDRARQDQRVCESDSAVPLLCDGRGRLLVD